jgi:hypothetical protein
MSMLADAVLSEAYRFTKNRMTVFWSVVFLPIALLCLSSIGQFFLKQKMAEIGNDPRLPPALLGQGALDLGHSLVKLAGDTANPLLLLFIMIGTATLYAGDYRWETWRLTSARNTRANLILGKVGVAKLLTLAALIVFLIFGFVGRAREGDDPWPELCLPLRRQAGGRVRPAGPDRLYSRGSGRAMLGLLAAVHDPVAAGDPVRAVGGVHRPVLPDAVHAPVRLDRHRMVRPGGHPGPGL